MAKLFISCPIRGRSIENINDSKKKMRKIAEIIFEEEFDNILGLSSDFAEEIPDDASPHVFHLGSNIQTLAETDYYIGLTHTEEVGDYMTECEIANKIAERYCIRRVLIDWMEICPDLIEMMKFNEAVKSSVFKYFNM